MNHRFREAADVPGKWGPVRLNPLLYNLRKPMNKDSELALERTDLECRSPSNLEQQKVSLAEAAAIYKLVFQPAIELKFRGEIGPLSGSMN